MVMMTLGSVAWSGKVSGAVNVAVEAVVVLVFWMLERAPTLPATLASSHALGSDAFGLGVAVVGSGVVVKVHLKSEETSVAPVTVAVMTSDCLGTSMGPREPETTTVT